MEDVRGRRILVALDESEESMYALKWARDYLHLDSTDTLILCHSKCLPIAYEGLGGPWFTLTPENKIELEKYQERVTEAIMQKARDICSGEPGESGGENSKRRCQRCTVRCGEEGEGRFSRRWKPWLCTVKRALLGSVSSYCAHHAKCPVMIIKKPHEHKA